ncbi:MAG: hypothetical protein EOO06_02125 [Chitinophagaceae bacterium]|nr:MAG: hypothetical protein EOO06_02125 [Chitinophagaceae bacterium]
MERSYKGASAYALPLLIMVLINAAILKHAFLHHQNGNPVLWITGVVFMLLLYKHFQHVRAAKHRARQNPRLLSGTRKKTTFYAATGD